MDYRLTPAAQRDLGSIWDFTCERWDARQAETYIVELREAVERIAVNPERGSSVDHIRPTYRRYAVGSHLIFYTVNEQYVAVIRFLHQRMDVTQHL